MSPNGFFSFFAYSFSEKIEKTLRDIQAHYPELNAQVRGLGLIYGLDIPDSEMAQAIAREAFLHGLIIERCGAKDNVLKFLPPLIIEDEVLKTGLEIVEQSVRLALNHLTT